MELWIARIGRVINATSIELAYGSRLAFQPVVIYTARTSTYTKCWECLEEYHTEKTQWMYLLKQLFDFQGMIDSIMRQRIQDE